jgi:hypothetical protein
MTGYAYSVISDGEGGWLWRVLDAHGGLAAQGRAGDAPEAEARARGALRSLEVLSRNRREGRAA